MDLALVCSPVDGLPSLAGERDGCARSAPRCVFVPVPSRRLGDDVPRSVGRLERRLRRVRASEAFCRWVLFLPSSGALASRHAPHLVPVQRLGLARRWSEHRAVAISAKWSITQTEDADDADDDDGT